MVRGSSLSLAGRIDGSDVRPGNMEQRPMMFILVLLFGILTGLSCAGVEQLATPPGPTTAPVQPVARIGGASYSVDMAVLPEERRQGLSGREYMAPDAGMLFVFEEEQQLHFWMKEMRFPLDIVWIDARCRLVGVSAEVPTPAPNAGNDEIPRARSPSPARFVLEVNAGEAARNGLSEGDAVEFQGAIAGQYGC